MVEVIKNIIRAHLAWEKAMSVNETAWSITWGINSFRGISSSWRRAQNSQEHIWQKSMKEWIRDKIKINITSKKLKPKGQHFSCVPSDLERILCEVDHHEQHEVAQKRFLVLLLHSPALFDQMNSDIHEAYQRKEVLPKYHFRTWS